MPEVGTVHLGEAEGTLVHLHVCGANSGLVVVPHAAMQADENALELALVVLVGGTWPAVSAGMVSHYLFERFGLTTLDADVRTHEPEDFVVRFRHLEDRNHVLAPLLSGHLPLIWQPWRRTFVATTLSFRYKVLVAMRSLPLHGHNAATAQVILGPCCANVEVVRPCTVPKEDDIELFVTAWCSRPTSIPDEPTIFIPEPVLPDVVEEGREALSGLTYPVRLRLVAMQDWSVPPQPPSHDDGEDDDDVDDGSHGVDDAPPPTSDGRSGCEGRRDCSDGDGGSDDSGGDLG